MMANHRFQPTGHSLRSRPAAEAKRSADLMGSGKAMVKQALQRMLGEWTGHSYLSYVGLKMIRLDFARGQ